MTTTAGQIIVNDCLPKEFRDYTRVMDSNGIEEVLERIARERPDVYKEVSQKLMSVGSDAAFDNGVTLRLSDCETGFDKKPFLKIVDDAEKRIASDKSLSRQDRLDALGQVYGDVQASIEKNTFDSELKKRNQLALQVASKARGTKGQLASFISTPGSFPDSNGRTVPMFIRHSFAEGLTPAEYWAGSFGTRTAVVGAKIATAKGGAFGKLLSQSAVNQVITEDDCGGANGVPMPIGDDDNIGAVLAVKTGKYDAGTVITKAVLADLRKDKKRDEIVIRSPMTCGCKSGVCSKCAGIRETGGFPPIGYNLGTNAASAFAERITQGALNTKHSGRLGGGDGPGKYQGFAMYTSLAKVPGAYPDKAELSSLDGTVENIEDAPQGGKYITVGDGSTSKKHYVAPGYMLLVKKGDNLEAGDQLSDGVINPAELVGYKGIGEARRYWANRFMQGFKDSGMKGNRRNAEVLAKTLINSVELNEEGPAGLPGDVTTYTNWAFNFKPRPDTKVLKPDAAKGMYLEQPVLHYTIGTRITPSVVKELTKFGQPRIFANANKPNVTPFMTRVEDSNAIKDDWMSRLSTTYLKDRLLEDAQRGSEAKLHSTNPYPSLAKGVEFGTWNQPGSRNKTETFTY